MLTLEYLGSTAVSFIALDFLFFGIALLSSVPIAPALVFQKSHSDSLFLIEIVRETHRRPTILANAHGFEKTPRPQRLGMSCGWEGVFY